MKHQTPNQPKPEVVEPEKADHSKCCTQCPDATRPEPPASNEVFNCGDFGCPKHEPSPASTEDWENEFDIIWSPKNEYAITVTGPLEHKNKKDFTPHEVKLFIRSHDQQLRQEEREALKKMVDRIENIIVKRYPATGREEKFVSAADLLNELK